MNELCVRADRLGKCFRALRRQRTVLRALRALAGPTSLRKDVWTLRDLSFEIPSGAKLAVIGRNGSGKTTLLRLLSGIYEPTCGDLDVATPPRPLFNYNIGLSAELTVSENIFLYGAMHEMARGFLAERREAIIRLAGLEALRDAPLKELSAGQRQRLALSVFFQTPSRFVIFDEALTNVDRGFLRVCDRHFDALLRSDRTVIFTGHDPALLRRYCRSALWLEDGRARMCGPLEDVLAAYEDALQREDATR